ncbi:Sugar phosphate isomerase/epimerase [Microbacterium sp. cf046]|uniref:sugar phosphate isomerase/epimerase family protein n=1 Tax=Microbacterium sp. cf046 TaxID=1761803 RepID=UPI0008F37153|nr:sugar phosphate isomerase/epimerase family protein [Microbacterium sp. cf046]SFR91938.1 Sugar phosphate isomerase/epimerase [Microbacterium sp. cf046]
MTSLTAQNWPIAAAALPFPGTTANGESVTDAAPDEWASTLTEIADAGFDRLDVTDSWLRVGDLSEGRLDDFAAVAREAGVVPTSISAIRRSVIDHANGDENLAYSHRTLDAAALLGIETVSFGLHQALTVQQQAQLWFWTMDGHKDDPADWGLAVRRLSELGRHAGELGLIVSLEMYEDTFLGTADSAVRLVQDIGMDNVGLNPDIGNLVRLHRPIESWWDMVEKTLPYANFWHVKNYARDEDSARGEYFAVPAPMQHGLIDYRRAFRYAIEQGFQGVICVENYGGDGLSVCADNRDYLRRHVLPKREGYALGTSRVRQPRFEGGAS